MATFQQGIEDGIHNFFVTKGRMSRSTYWWFFLFCYLIVIGLGILIGIAGGFQRASSVAFINIVADITFYYLMIIPGIRRLHDIDKRGDTVWLVLIPIVGWIYLIYLFLKPSDPEDNYFGPKPWI